MDTWPHKFKVASDIREEDINSHTEQF